jgi:hypothetical protein
VATDTDPVERSPASPARDGAQAAARSGHLRRLAAAGLLGYAAIHLLVGWLAWSLAWQQGSPSRTGDRAADSSGALGLVADSPVGAALLWALAVGLAGLCVWQAVEVLRHHRHLPPPGRRRQALVQLVKTVGTACLYGYLAVSAARTALGDRSGSGEGERTVSGVLGWPGGELVVTAVAVVVGVIGVYLAQKGARSQFVDEIALDRFSPSVRTAVLRLSQVGFVLKGIALVLVGVVVGWAALTSRPERGDGLDDTLRIIAQEPFGRWLLTVIAGGLAAFAVYCLARARHPVG